MERLIADGELLAGVFLVASHCGVSESATDATYLTWERNGTVRTDDGVV